MKAFSAYPAFFQLSRDGVYSVRFRDFENAGSEGRSLEEALHGVHAALIGAMKACVARGELIPEPSDPQPGEELVRLAPSLGVKILLVNDMIRTGTRPSELARRMGILPQEASRLLNLGHASKIDTLARALEALDLQLVCSVQLREG